MQNLIPVDIKSLEGIRNLFKAPTFPRRKFDYKNLFEPSTNRIRFPFRFELKAKKFKSKLDMELELGFESIFEKFLKKV
jgi:hypothetical protein